MKLMISGCRSKKETSELDSYLTRKHDALLKSTLEPGSYKKTLSLVIVDGFSVEITEEQVLLLSLTHIYMGINNVTLAILCLFLVFGWK